MVVNGKRGASSLISFGVRISPSAMAYRPGLPSGMSSSILNFTSAAWRSSSVRQARNMRSWVGSDASAGRPFDFRPNVSFPIHVHPSSVERIMFNELSSPVHARNSFPSRSRASAGPKSLVSGSVTGPPMANTPKSSPTLSRLSIPVQAMYRSPPAREGGSPIFQPGAF